MIFYGKKRAGFSNHVKNRVLESYSNIFFPLVDTKAPVFTYVLFPKSIESISVIAKGFCFKKSPQEVQK